MLKAAVSNYLQKTPSWMIYKVVNLSLELRDLFPFVCVWDSLNKSVIPLQ